MQTPVFTQKQKRLTLSSKKPKKEIIKNVLVNPHENYWPIVRDELEEITRTVEENLPLIRKKKINVPWNVLKSVPRTERRAARNEFIQKNSSEFPIIEKNNFIFGVNEVTKSLETGICSIVLVEEVNPRILVQHIFDLCVLHEIPVLIIPGLKQILGKCCGLESMAIAIKKDFQVGSNEENIVQKIVEIHKNYLPSLNHINSNRKCNLIQKLPDKGKISEKIVQSKIEEKSHTIKKYHLHRSSFKERVFNPELSSSVTSKNQSDETFWQFSNVETMDLVTPVKEISYRPLKVKRLKGNKNRELDMVKNPKRKRK